jgi:hypothetical protein
MLKYSTVFYVLQKDCVNKRFIFFLFVGGLRVKMKEYPLIPASFVSFASDHTTTLMGRRLAILRLIHFMIELLFNNVATGNHLLLSYKHFFQN